MLGVAFLQKQRYMKSFPFKTWCFGLHLWQAMCNASKITKIYRERIFLQTKQPSSLKGCITKKAIEKGKQNHYRYVQQRAKLQHIHITWANAKERISLNEVRFIYIPKACRSLRSVKNGIWVHNEIAHRRFLRNVLYNGSVDMYIKSGVVAKAREAVKFHPTEDSLEKPMVWYPIHPFIRFLLLI